MLLGREATNQQQPHPSTTYQLPFLECDYKASASRRIIVEIWKHFPKEDFLLCKIISYSHFRRSRVTFTPCVKKKKKNDQPTVTSKFAYHYEWGETPVWLDLRVLLLYYPDISPSAGVDPLLAVVFV